MPNSSKCLSMSCTTTGMCVFVKRKVSQNNSLISLYNHVSFYFIDMYINKLLFGFGTTNLLQFDI